MLAGYWVPRDANWSPDFPTTAQKAQELYTLSTGVSTQGVIAFDQSVIIALLSVLGPVQLADLEERITAENVESYMQAAWEPGKDKGNEAAWWAHRKDFMAVLGKTLLETLLQQQDPGVLVRLLRQVTDLVNQGHLLLYLNDPDAQNWLKYSGWDGRVELGSGDFLMLVDSNIGFNKMDAVIQRSLTYQIDLRDPDHPKAHLFLKYLNPVDQKIPCLHQASYGESFGQILYNNMRERCYWDYWRIYLPPDTAMIQATVPTIPAHELLTQQDWSGPVETYPGEGGLQVVAGVMVLPTREEETLEFIFSLPASRIAFDDQGRIGYSLHLQKQPGLETLDVRLEVLLPPGYHAQTGLTSEIYICWASEGAGLL
jgi:hypothetical protein